MSKLSAISALKESDLQIPNGQITGEQLREAFRRLFTQLNPYFDGLNKLAAKGITFADNVACEQVSAKFSHGVAQQVLLKTLKRATGVIPTFADGQVIDGCSVQMVQIPPTAKYGPLASVTVYFIDPAAVNVTCNLLLL